MKAILVAGVALLFASLAFARPAGVNHASADLELAETKLLDEVQCDNCDIKDAAIYNLGELRSSRAVIPLMAVLHSDQEESSRIVAALALCRIGDARGTFAVKRAATFDGSAKVRARAAWFYNTYVEEGSFRFEPAPAAMANKVD